MFLNGLRVQVSPDRPRVQLSGDLLLTEGFRASYNAWLLARFGTTNLVEDGMVYRASVPTLFGPDEDVWICNPRTFEQLCDRMKVNHGGL